MDTITVIPDPADKMKMLNIVKNHARFTLLSAAMTIKTQLEL